MGSYDLAMLDLFCCLAGKCRLTIRHPSSVHQVAVSHCELMALSVKLGIVPASYQYKDAFTDSEGVNATTQACYFKLV